MLNKKVALPWGLFALTAVYAMMRPCTIVNTPCNSTDVLPQDPVQQHVHYVQADQVNVSVHAEHDQVQYEVFQSELGHVDPVHHEHQEVVHHVRLRTDHARASVVQASVDEHPSTLFVMSVTLLTYLFIKVVVVPPRGYKKYI